MKRLSLGLGWVGQVPAEVAVFQGPRVPGGELDKERGRHFLTWDCRVGSARGRVGALAEGGEQRGSHHPEHSASPMFQHVVGKCVCRL